MRVGCKRMHWPASCSAYGETKWADEWKEGERDERHELVNERGSERACERRSLHGTFLRVKSKVNPEEEGPSLFAFVHHATRGLSILCHPEKMRQKHWTNSIAVCLGRYMATEIIYELNYKIEVLGKIIKCYLLKCVTSILIIMIQVPIRR